MVNASIQSVFATGGRVIPFLPAPKTAAVQLPVVVKPFVTFPVRVVKIGSALTARGSSVVSRPPLTSLATPVTTHTPQRVDSFFSRSPFAQSGFDFALPVQTLTSQQTPVAQKADDAGSSNSIKTVAAPTTVASQSLNPGAEGQNRPQTLLVTQTSAPVFSTPSTARTALQPQAQQTAATETKSNPVFVPTVPVAQVQVTEGLSNLSLSPVDSESLAETAPAPSSADFAAHTSFPQGDDFAGAPVFGFDPAGITDPVAIFSNPAAYFTGLSHGVGTDLAFPVFSSPTPGHTTTSRMSLAAPSESTGPASLTSSSGQFVGRSWDQTSKANPGSSDLSDSAATPITQGPLVLDLRAAPVGTRQVHSEAEPESLYRVNATSGASPDSDGSPDDGQNHPDQQ